MKNPPLYRVAVLAALTACTSGVPYRNGDYGAIPSCEKTYGAYDAALLSVAAPPIEEGDNCWKQSRESHRDYDVLFVEFDDQGWVQDAAKESNPTKADHLSKLYESIRQIREKPDKTQQRLSIVVFVHGWQHNAEATDSNVHAFRRLLRQVDTLEAAAAGQGPKPRVVGIYVGWRGKSLTIPILDNTTFWERKNTAERVAQGQVQELFRWLDLFRDTGTDPTTGERNVTVLTIGHSFGGLITFEALSGEFVRNAVRFKRNVEKPNDHYMSRVGDLVVIVNPAFEGARYEVLRAAVRRLPDVERNQLPVVIVATSTADVATRYFFPLARWFNTVFEATSGEEQSATVLAVGHNPRYITHDLSLCAPDNTDCQEACKAASGTASNTLQNNFEAKAAREYSYMFAIAERGFDHRKAKPGQQYLCDGLELRWTEEAYPDHNPFWVVRTTDDIMHGHNDIFNANMVAFARQMYTGFVAARNQFNEKMRSQPKNRK
ncbi:MAG TPA: hypothetical protein VEL09_14330 [Burkholderiales bacterium]|nr:hypothetical protein [Burkholderiales bacterium]